MISKIHSITLNGIDAILVEVEVDIAFGLPVFNMVGLAETAVRESKERVKAAVNNAGYTFPMDRVVVNLAPADVQKGGTGLDLPVAVAILGASGLIERQCLNSYLIFGELSLDGRIKPVQGVLPLALKAKENGFKGVIIPEENAPEAALVEGLEVLPAGRLSQIVDFFSGHTPIRPFVPDPEAAAPETAGTPEWDLSDVKGQAHAKRALEISAAGGHHLLMTGPPGSGKSMLAKRLATLLPAPSFDEMMEVTRIYSVTGLLETSLSGMMKRPFRAPHHTISDAGLVGGGPKPMPGEISLAHHGVLFMDELPEFKKNVLEVLRQPLEEGRVTIARAGMKSTFPCQFMLVAAMNPCPCGLLSDPDGTCTCSMTQVRAYRSRISGPLLDRMDLQVEVPRVKFRELMGRESAETSDRVRGRVAAARKIQNSRFRATPVFCNARMGNREIRGFCPLDSRGEQLLERASDAMNLSARACHSVIKTARTIADLAGDGAIRSGHLAEALQYRGFDRDVK